MTTVKICINGKILSLKFINGRHSGKFIKKNTNFSVRQIRLKTKFNQKLHLLSYQSCRCKYTSFVKIATFTSSYLRSFMLTDDVRKAVKYLFAVLKNLQPCYCSGPFNTPPCPNGEPHNTKNSSSSVHWWTQR